MKKKKTKPKKIKAGNFQKIKATGFPIINVTMMVGKKTKGTVPPQQAPPNMKTPVYGWTFDSSSSDKTYETLQYDDGSLSCDCPGWTRRAQRSCKHTRGVELGTANSSAVKHGPLGQGAKVPVPAPSTVEATPTNVVQTTFEREFS